MCCENARKTIKIEDFKFFGTRGLPHNFRGNKKSDTFDVALLLSGRRDSNSRPSAWKADALSTELLPLVHRSFSEGVQALFASYGNQRRKC